MLTPIILSDVDLENITEEAEAEQPSKTYKINFETGEILAEFIDNEDAVIQAAVKAIKTKRDAYLIYSTDYGCEIFYLIGQGYSIEYLELEVPRLIDEALMLDERISETRNYNIQIEGDSLYVEFEMVINSGDIAVVEVVL